MIEEDDVLLLLGRRERVDKLVDWGLLVGRENGSREARHDYRVDMTEVIIPPRSAAIGKTLKDLRFRNKYGLTTVALWRGGRSYRTDVGITPLEVGDALLMVGPIPRIKQLSRDRDFLVLESSHVHQPPARHKARWALLITLLVLVAAIINIFPLPEVMMLGAVAMILTGCVTMDEAYRAIEWQVIFLIAGIWPLSIALVNTGLADRVGEVLIAGFGSYGPLVLIAGAFFTTVALTQIIGGQVASLIIGPVAIAAAIQQAVNPQAMAVAVAIGCSTAFLTPMSHAVNVLMMGPGGYTTRDFLRVGLGMTLVTFFGLLLALLLIWNIH
jgi:di/tricarboxylate transporter